MIDRKTLFVSDGGGKLDIVSEEGELLASIALPPGQVPALPYLDLVPPGATLQVSEGVATLRKRHRIGIQPYGPGSHDSGANPDYQPTSASRMEREMRVMMSRLQASEKRVDAKMRALAKVERVPDATAAATEPEVIEPQQPVAQPEAQPADG